MKSLFEFVHPPSLRRRRNLPRRSSPAEALEERLLLSGTSGQMVCPPTAVGELAQQPEPSGSDGQATGSCAAQPTGSELTFVSDPGQRISDGAIPEVGIDPETNSVYLYYKIGPDTWRATSEDGGLEFGEPEQPGDMSFDPRGVRMPRADESGRTVWRRIRWEANQQAFTSLVSYDGSSYTPEDGVRYAPPDTIFPGVFTVFSTAEGRVGLMYIGDKGLTTGNVRLAYSDDNGQSFTLHDTNPLGDAGTHDQGLNQRDPAAIVLDDGRVRVFTMVQGGSDAPLPGSRAVTSIHSFTSSDDGLTFTEDAGVRLSPEDFSGFDVWSLNDPSIIPLPDGRFRMYVAGLVSVEPDASDAHWVILSATTKLSDDDEPGLAVPVLEGPTGTIAETNPEFHWGAVEAATGYEFQILHEAGGAPGNGQPDPPAEPPPGVPGEVTVTRFEDGSVECRPTGDGPFPAVLYNHGGLGTAVGGDLLGTCTALAEAGFYSRSEQRPPSVSLDGQLEDVLAGLDQLRANPDVDSDRIALVGFSRGGLLALQAAVERPNEIDSLLLFAPAPGRGSMAETLEQVPAVAVPIQIFIAENDSLLPLAHEIEQALVDAEKDVGLTVYEAFEEDGHDLFFEVREQYWGDVLEFLESTLDDPVVGGGLQVEHLASVAMPQGTHRPEILFTGTDEMLAVVVDPGEDGQGQRFKHRVYRYDARFNQVGDPFPITWITDEYGEPADHRAAVVDGELVVVYQSLVYDDDVQRTEGPSEQYALNQSLMLTRYSLDGQELFRGPIVAHATDFSEDSFPDHCLVPLEDSLLVSTGAGQQIKLREVGDRGEVLNTYAFDTREQRSLSVIGNSLLDLGDRLWMFAGSGMGSLEPNGISVLELDDRYQPTELAWFGDDDLERTFPTGALQYNGFTLVTYDARESLEQFAPPEEHPYRPRLMVLDADLEMLADIEIGNGDGFAHVHPTLGVDGDELVIGWSMQSDSAVDAERIAPQVQLERYALSSLLGEPSEDSSGELDGRQDAVAESSPVNPIAFQVVTEETSARAPELEPGSYQARVRAVSESGVPGEWSRSLVFSVDVAQPENGPVDFRFDVDRGMLVLQLREPVEINVEAVGGSLKILVDGSPVEIDEPLLVEAIREIEVQGSSGDDLVDLGAVTIEAFVNLERVRIAGRDGNDVLLGSALPDRIDGGAGDDVLRGGGGPDRLRGGPGADRLNGQRGNDRLDGGDGDDTLAGGAGADLLAGGLGDDVLNGHAGIDGLVEAGNHDFVLKSDSLSGPGNDRLRSLEQAELTGGDDDNRMDASGFDGPVSMFGAGGDDILVGGNSGDLLAGGPGSDRINGRGGADVLDGNEDDDRVIGGGGNDRMTGGHGDDVLKGQGGVDVLQEIGNVDFQLSDHRLDGHGRDRLAGIEAARLEGGEGDNRIDASGFSGTTTLLGAAGDDQLLGGAAYDRLDGGRGDDRIDGRGGNDVLIGRAGRDVMFGGAGDDRILGGADNDVALGGEGHDRINGQGGGHDTVAGGAGQDWLGDDVHEIDEVFRLAGEWIDEA
ncbi:MAG: hypothetical protein CMJ65_10225 [Planctomycetaceae bacterium]|nr:hypothetical protein [Planctomycetaceae bacterium]